MEEVRIKSSKVRCLLLILPAIGLFIFGLTLLNQDIGQIEVQQKFSNPIFLYGFAIISLITGIIGLVICIPKFLGFRPGLVINQDGLYENSSGVSAGFVPWNEVRSITKFNVGSQLFIAIHVKDPLPYLKKGNYLQRIIKKSNMSIRGTPVGISMATLNADFEILYKLIHEYKDYYQSE
jgi:hypothetical protein